MVCVLGSIFFQCADKNVYFYAFICPPHWYHFNQLFFLQNSVLSFALSPKSLKSRRCSFPIFARFLSFAFNPLKLLPLNLISNVRLNVCFLESSVTLTHSLNQPSQSCCHTVHVDYRNDPNIPETCRVTACRNLWNSFN